MGLLDFVRRSPVTVLGAFCVALGVWVWCDSAPNHQPRVVGAQPSEPDSAQVCPNAGLDDERPFCGGEERAKPNPQNTTQILSKLKPGMLRTEVEALAGVPATQNIHPATITDGQVRYQVTYEADFQPVPLVRVLSASRPRSVEGDPKPRILVTLEYDATKPGHPLLGLSYSGRLF
jgi:hypothetical protein